MSRATEELLEAGRELATVAERLRDHAPRAVDAALARWMVAVHVHGKATPTPADRLLRSARRLQRAHHGPIPQLLLAIEDVVEAIAAHDEAVTFARLRAGRVVDVEVEVRS